MPDRSGTDIIEADTGTPSAGPFMNIDPKLESSRAYQETSGIVYVQRAVTVLRDLHWFLPNCSTHCIEPPGRRSCVGGPAIYGNTRELSRQWHQLFGWCGYMTACAFAAAAFLLHRSLGHSAADGRPYAAARLLCLLWRQLFG
ncbi:hypothetical protein DFH09DRAFT_1334731 [Mycena vulgaris]|nr:hypothetical protein DFH09DRAFT_1334731 [Mycena vulgaris]